MSLLLLQKMSLRQRTGNQIDSKTIFSRMATRSRMKMYISEKQTCK